MSKCTSKSKKTGACMQGSVRFVRLIGAFLLLGGIAIFGLTAVMNYLQGDVWAVTENGRFVNRWSAVIIDAVGIVVIGFAAGAAYAAGKRGWGHGLTFMMILSAVASINSMASFQATERMSASKTREAAIDRIKDADKLQAANATAALKMAAGADTKTARRDFIAANKEAVDSFRNAKVEVQVAPDAGAELWASFSGWTVAKIQMVQAAYLAVLLILLKMVCFQAAGFFLNPLGWLKPVATSTESNKSSSSGNTGNSSGNKDSNIVPLKPAETSTPSIRAESVAATPPVERPKSATPQRSVTPVASAPWSAGDVDAYLKQLPLMAVRPTWRQLGAMAGWNWNTLYKRGQRLRGEAKGKRVLGQHRQQHRHQEGNSAFI